MRKSVVLYLIVATLVANTTTAKILQQTYTYKKVDDLEIKLDVYREDDKVTRPVVVWIHGGALMVGGREWIDKRVKNMFLEAGYTVVSIDYRLAPETRLPAIIEDVEDAFKWARKKGPKLSHIDSSRVAVLGGSAGGYLTLTTGYRVKPRPTVLVSFYGYGDLIGEWQSTPSPHRCHQNPKLPENELRRCVNGPPLANSKGKHNERDAFYVFCRRRGIWPQEASGWEPYRQSARYRPYMPVKNVTKDYPPTLLIHGTEDTDVPHEQSVMMVDEFKKHGVDHELISILDGEHGLGGGDPNEINSAYERAFQFVHARMNRK